MSVYLWIILYFRAVWIDEVARGTAYIDTRADITILVGSRTSFIFCRTGLCYLVNHTNIGAITLFCGKVPCFLKSIYFRVIYNVQKLLQENTNHVNATERSPSMSCLCAACIKLPLFH